MGDWTGFFAAEVGAAAALAGLVMVAISINLQRILSEPGLVGRAAETLVAPSGVLIVASLALVPGQPRWLFGAEAVAVGAGMALAPVLVLSGLHRMQGHRGAGYIAARVALAVACCVPFLVSGVLLLLGSPFALYWMVPGVVVSLVSTVIAAWVLLVEILR
jgi:modulator of FtsH protease